MSKIYMNGSELTVLDNVTVHIKRNEYVGIFGPSGSGKSTMLHIIGLLDRPSVGRVFFRGRDITTLSDEEASRTRGREIGFVFQSFHLVPNLSVLENVELPLFYQGVKAAERSERAKTSLDRVRMSHRLGHLPSQLSGGERQRTAIARALVTDPDLILADEPTGNLDSKTGQEILDFLDLLHSEGKTIIMITHDVAIARRLPRLLRINDGRVTEGDRP
ncbi:MAG TPA: ABC transporter ATP-binding protein [Kiritimatiellia bacterium]|nr:ABC transporter ATP-binding protein [Kiritimatiellia bacterium]